MTQSTRARLTPRECEIAQLVAEGLTNEDIATRLGISNQTVRHTLVKIYLKAGVSNRASLTRFWLTSG